MALDFTAFQAALQDKLNSTTDAKEMLLLGKAIEATIGAQSLSEVQAEGETQVAAVQAAGATQVDDVQAAGATQLGLVEAAGAAQVNDVQDEGTTQIGLLQLVGAGYAQMGVANTWTAQQTFEELKETVYTLTGTEINPANGTIQYKALSANTTFTETLESGQSVLLRITGGDTHVVTWPALTWVGGSAPTLTAADFVVVWKDAAGAFAAYVGSVAE